MPLYNQPDGYKFGWKLINSTDKKKPNLIYYEQNGKPCKSGLAFNSNPDEVTCVTVDSVWQDKTKLIEPYKCDPTDPKI